MTERTALFLASLSHKWSPLVLPLPIVFGVATYCSGVLQARTRARAGTLARRVATVLQVASCALLAVSIFVFSIAFLHIGCAAVKAHSVQCMSNVRQLALGALMYAHDYDERLPATARWDEAIGSRVMAAARSDTVANGDPFRCPAAEAPASYEMNAALGGISLSDIDAPANTVLLFDADALTRSFTGGPNDVARTRHSGAPNVAFADGHARYTNAFVLKELSWTPKDARGQRQAGR